MNRRRNTTYVARNKLVKVTEMPKESPLMSENQLDNRLETGYINVRVSTALGALPVSDAVITLYSMDLEGNERAMYHLVSDMSGNVPKMSLPVSYDPQNPLESSQYFFSTYNLRVQSIGYYTQNIFDLRVFPDTTTNFNITLIPVKQGGHEDENPRSVVIPPNPVDISNV